MIIRDEDVLWRRLHPGWVNDGVLSSIAFVDRRSGKVSVHWSGGIALADVRRHLKPTQLDEVAEIAAGEPRSLECRVEHVPTPDDPSHSQFYPLAPSTSGARRIAKMLALKARLVSLP